MMCSNKKNDSVLVSFVVGLLSLTIVVAGTAFYSFYWSPHVQFEQAFGRPWTKAESASADERLAIVAELCDLQKGFSDKDGMLTEKRQAIQAMPCNSPRMIVEKVEAGRAIHKLEIARNEARDNFSNACQAARSAGFTAEADACGCNSDLLLKGGL